MKPLWRLALLFSLVLHTTASACEMTYEGYRVFVGPDRSVDWIDVGVEYEFVSTDNGSISTLQETFRDDSPILKVFQWNTEPTSCGFEIIKEQSCWLLASPDGRPDTYRMRRAPFSCTEGQYHEAKGALLKALLVL